MNISGDQTKVPLTGNKIFDLEDEDNMAIVDQAGDDIEDYFLRFSLF